MEPNLSIAIILFTVLYISQATDFFCAVSCTIETISLTEQELIHRCVKKDAGAQRLLYERYAPQMMTVCRRYCPSPQSAEDLLQEAFVKVFTSLHQFRSQGSLEGWIKKIFVNCALRKLERKVLAFTVLSHEQEEQFYADPEILHQLNEEELLILIRELPEGYRTVFNLHVIDGYTHDEISVMLGIATVTSRSQLAKARKQLQQKIQSIVNQ